MYVCLKSLVLQWEKGERGGKEQAFIRREIQEKAE
jgi:hypothetical protein